MGHLGGVSERPRGVPGASLGNPRDAQEALQGLPGTPRRGLGDPFEALRRQKCASEPEFCAHLACERARTEFHSIFG